LYTALIICCIPVAYVLYLVYKLLRELDNTGVEKTEAK
jgi:cell division protein FtsL